MLGLLEGAMQILRLLPSPTPFESALVLYVDRRDSKEAIRAGKGQGGIGGGCSWREEPTQ